MHTNQNPATLDDLDAILGMSDESHPWVTSLVQQGTTPLHESDILEIAAEVTGPGVQGTAATIYGLLDGLALRMQGDATAQAMLAALRHYHVPTLLDAV